MIGVSAIAATLFFGGYLGPLIGNPGVPGWLQGLLGVFYFIVKIALLLFGMIWIRATLPRIRYDRLMAFGWKMLFPLALGNVLITAVGVILNALWGVPIFSILF